MLGQSLKPRSIQNLNQRRSRDIESGCFCSGSLLESDPERITGTEYYASSIEHILAELERIDLLIQLQVKRARESAESDSEFQGLYISERQVDELLSRPIGLPPWAVITTPGSQADIGADIDRMGTEIAERKTESARRGVSLRLDVLTQLFELTPFDKDALLICVAPELDLRYERVYAYLQDDVTKKRPSLDLILNLLSVSFEGKLSARLRLNPESPLIKNTLLDLVYDPSHHQPPQLSRYLKIDDRVVNYLLGLGRT